MSKKKNGLLIFLSIITLGIFYIFFLIATKKNNPEKRVATLKKLVGGEDNIEKLEEKAAKVKFFLKDISKVEMKKIQKLNYIKGVMKGTNQITFIFERI